MSVIATIGGSAADHREHGIEAKVIGFSAKRSSIAKGEILKNTTLALDTPRPDWAGPVEPCGGVGASMLPVLGICNGL